MSKKKKKNFKKRPNNKVKIVAKQAEKKQSKKLKVKQIKVKQNESKQKPQTKTEKSKESKTKFSNVKNKRIVIAAIVVTVVALLALVGIFVFKQITLYTSARIEVSTEVFATDFAKTNKFNVSFARENEFDVNVPGTYKIHLKVGYLTYSVKLTVEDTVPPEFELLETTVGCGEDVEASALVASCTDKTTVTFSYLTAPDFSKIGEQEITIVATDLGNNEVQKTVKVIVTPVVNKLVFEAGDDFPEASAFLTEKYNGTEASFVLPDDFKAKDVMGHVGKTELTVLVEDVEYKTNIEIQDTVAPILKGKDLSSYTLLTISPRSMVASCTDKTDVTYSFETAPSKTYVGTQTLTLIATDEGGNTASTTVKLTLQNDTEAPVIYGAKDITIYPGNTIAYRKIITVSDNSGSSNVTLKIDSSKVNIKAIGTYPVYCTATDKAGNTTSASFNVIVRERTYTQSELNAKCDKILSSIITPGMSNRQKCSAIYTYIRKHMHYTAAISESNWIKAAILGFEDQKGNCFTYASEAKALLTRAGITNMDIKKGAGAHYWNLVDIGDGHGWYHFDVTPWKGTTEQIFLWTEAQLMEFSNSRGGTHDYDHSLYPEVA